MLQSTLPCPHERRIPSCPSKLGQPTRLLALIRHSVNSGARALRGTLRASSDDSRHYQSASQAIYLLGCLNIGTEHGVPSESVDDGAAVVLAPERGDARSDAPSGETESISTKPRASPRAGRHRYVPVVRHRRSAEHRDVEVVMGAAVRRLEHDVDALGGQPAGIE